MRKIRLRKIRGKYVRVRYYVRKTFLTEAITEVRESEEGPPRDHDHDGPLGKGTRLRLNLARRGGVPLIYRSGDQVNVIMVSGVGKHATKIIPTNSGDQSRPEMDDKILAEHGSAAAATLAGGLDALFRRLGPPPDELLAEYTTPVTAGGGGARS